MIHSISTISVARSICRYTFEGRARLCNAIPHLSEIHYTSKAKLICSICGYTNPKTRGMAFHFRACSRKDKRRFHATTAHPNAMTLTTSTSQPRKMLHLSASVQYRTPSTIHIVIDRPYRAQVVMFAASRQHVDSVHPGSALTFRCSFCGQFESPLEPILVDARNAR